MSQRTPEQKIAELELKLKRAKEEQRKARTKRLIELGASVEKAYGGEVEPLEAMRLIRQALKLKDLGEYFDKMPDQQRENLLTALRRQLMPTPPASSHNA